MSRIAVGRVQSTTTGRKLWMQDRLRRNGTEHGKSTPLVELCYSEDADMLTVHLDSAGIDFLIEQLSILKELLDQGRCEDCHLFTPESIGSELTVRKSRASERSGSWCNTSALCMDTGVGSEKHQYSRNRAKPIALPSNRIRPHASFIGRRGPMQLRAVLREC